MHTLLQVLETIAAEHPDIQAQAYGAVLLCALCLARGDIVAGVTRALGMSEQENFDILKAQILNVAQLTWSSPATHQKMDSAAKVPVPFAHHICIGTLLSWMQCTAALVLLASVF